jgi:hypothetical protein
MHNVCQLATPAFTITFWQSVINSFPIIWYFRSIVCTMSCWQQNILLHKEWRYWDNPKAPGDQRQIAPWQPGDPAHGSNDFYGGMAESITAMAYGSNVMMGEHQASWSTEATSLDWKISSVWHIPLFRYGCWWEIEDIPVLSLKRWKNR